jgi:hypothetical protein
VQDYRNTVDCEVWNNTQVDQNHFSHVEDWQSLVDYCKLVCYTSKLPHLLGAKEKKIHTCQSIPPCWSHREGFDKTCKLLTDQLHLKIFATSKVEMVCKKKYNGNSKSHIIGSQKP